MSLSRTLVEESTKSASEITSLEEVKHRNRALTIKWFKENPAFEAEVSQHYTTITSKDFESNKEEVFNGYSDHYSEKIFGFGTTTENYLSQLGKIKYKTDDIEKIKKAVANNTTAGFIGHLGGMEFIPTFFAKMGIPVTVLLRFKSDEARTRTFAQNKRLKEDLDLTLLDIDNNLYRNLKSTLLGNRLLISVFDGFDNWKIDKRVGEVEWKRQQVELDSTSVRIHSMTGKGPIFYIKLIRVGHDYILSVEDVSEKQDNNIAESLFNSWKGSVEENPHQWYIWDELNLIFGDN
jgi:hypothetical protein